MAGPQVQEHSYSHSHSHSHSRPNSAYYMGLNGGGGGNSTSGIASIGHHHASVSNSQTQIHTHPHGTAISSTTVAGSSSSTHAGLHALRQMSHDMELIYHGNTDAATAAAAATNVSHSVAATSQLIEQQQPTVLGAAAAAGRAQTTANAYSGSCFVESALGGGGGAIGDQIVSIAGTGARASDALIVPSSSSASASAAATAAAAARRSNLAKSKSKQRSIEIVVDAAQCVAGSDGDADGLSGGSKSGDDIEQGRRMSRHRKRPLHRRFLNYLRNLFQGTTTQTDSELEEFETPARYRPDSLSALSRATRFTEDEIKRIYRGFKAECPTGVVKEDTFKVIYSQFFPQGGSCANPTLYAHYVFNTLDQDHSGIISFEDFVQGLSILSRGSVEEKLRWTFSLYDINGDGHITREEMTDIVTAIYELMGRFPDDCPEEVQVKYKVDHLFQKMDKNRDGVVTLDEFLETCRSDEAISRSMSVFDSSF